MALKLSRQLPIPPLWQSAPRDSLRLPLAPRRLTAAGALLLAGAWWLAWFGPSPFSWYYFFPLWLGYILTADGLTLWRTGTSLLTRDPLGFALLFAISAPFWWGFEAANERLGSWEYLLPRDVSTLHYVALATISFSTVIPALFETAALLRSFAPFRRERHWLRIAPRRRTLVAIAIGGAIMLLLSLLFPGQAFALIWLGCFFVLDPLNALLGGRSIVGQVSRGRWDTVWVLFVAGLICGILWEGWNYWSSPKWIYHVPLFAWLPIFEMPLLGYGAYLPFALEIYACYQLCHLLLFRRPDDRLGFDEPAPPRPAASSRT